MDKNMNFCRFSSFLAILLAPCWTPLAVINIKF
jgi:hypothetical protein